MILHPIDLPSKGIDPKSKLQDITPMNFQELLDYTEEHESAKTELQKFAIDLKYLKKHCTDYDVINLMDLDYCIFIFKQVSVSSNSEFSTERTCPECEKVQTLHLTLEQIGKSQDLLFHIKGKIKLKEQEWGYTIPTVVEFEDYLTQAINFRKKIPLKLMRLVRCLDISENSLNKAEDLVLNAVQDDVKILSVFDNMYFQILLDVKSKCNNCKYEGWSISVEALIDHVFRSLLLSGKSPSTQIQAEQIR